MKRTGIFYGSQTGNTAAAARLIADELGIPPSDVRDIASASTDEVMAFDSLILGTSTWGTGELQGTGRCSFQNSGPWIWAASR